MYRCHTGYLGESPLSLPSFLTLFSHSFFSFLDLTCFFYGGANLSLWRALGSITCGMNGWMEGGIYDGEGDAGVYGWSLRDPR